MSIQLKSKQNVEAQSNGQEQFPLDMDLDDLLGGEADAPMTPDGNKPADIDAATRAAIEQIDLSASQDEEVDDGSPLIICPHCWHKFHQSHIYSISRHPSLIGDTVLGENAQIRFLATHFTADGTALDARGMPCPELACPRCHLQIPEAMLRLPCSQISIVGSPSSGKSYFLTAMLFQLKEILMQFNYSLAEAESSMDVVLSRYEQLLFHNTAFDTYVSLPKTELQGNDFSSQVQLDGINMQLPLPFIYTLKPVFEGLEGKSARNLVLYDNAGEHFEPGRDVATNPATQHLINSECIIFLFDPFKDSRSLMECSKDDPQASAFRQTVDQLQILNEMIARIKKGRLLTPNGKCSALLIVVVPKFDAWASNFPIKLSNDDYTGTHPENGFQALNITNIRLVSYAARQWLLRHAPALPSVAEGAFENVYYVPVSALGCSPEYDRERNILGVRPGNLTPLWCDVPMLLYLWHTGYISGIYQPIAGATPVDQYCTVRDGLFFFRPPGSKFMQPVPAMFHDADVFDENMGLIHFPRCPEAKPDGQQSSGQVQDDFWTT